jgi:E3 ubiquitin-protein ligase HUWE1
LNFELPLLHEDQILNESIIFLFKIQWFWRALKSFDKDDQAKFLQFVTGTSKVPLQGFAKLEGMNGPQKFQIHRDDRDTSRLPCAHTW